MHYFSCNFTVMSYFKCVKAQFYNSRLTLNPGPTCFSSLSNSRMNLGKELIMNCETGL